MEGSVGLLLSVARGVVAGPPLPPATSMGHMQEVPSKVVGRRSYSAGSVAGYPGVSLAAAAGRRGRPGPYTRSKCQEPRKLVTGVSLSLLSLTLLYLPPYPSAVGEGTHITVLLSQRSPMFLLPSDTATVRGNASTLLCRNVRGR